ncbi:uncharacterized protein NPIL_477691 [Nephila pilipes]|uniref:Uncharacterized protein n=1 Tax=Nephila pilipes TaxID=299642 RepID=A0A8X6PU44_NEPPI|nr:uncharacterized protein NPIL_477691 [Nephila pilipes]
MTDQKTDVFVYSHLRSKTNISLNQHRRNLPQALNEIRTKLERIDLTLSGLMEPVKKENVMDQDVNMLRLPANNDVPESVKSLINEKKMKLIQSSLKMSLQRLQSTTMRKRNPVSAVNEKKKGSGYFIPHDLERKRTVARRMYLASLEKTVNKPGSLLTVVKEKEDVKKNSFKSKFPKIITKSRKNISMDYQNEPEITLIASEAVNETKDDNIENVVDAIVDDLMGETVLIMNKIKQRKSQKSSLEIKKTIEIFPKKQEIASDFKQSESGFKEKSNWEKIRHSFLNIPTHSAQKQDQIEVKSRFQASEDQVNEEPVTVLKYISLHDNNQPESLTIDTHLIQKELSVDSKVTEDILKCRKGYWNYLERISRTEKGNFNPWVLSNLIAESLLDDCIHEISQELQDVPASLISDLYDQEFVQSI